MNYSYYDFKTLEKCKNIEVRLLNNNVENLSPSLRKEYYKSLREQCILIKNNQFQYGQDLIKKVYPVLRNYKLEIQGEENIPRNSNVIFLANHSNSHDIFISYEVFSYLHRRGSVMVATDCLNSLTTSIFNVSNATLLDRTKKQDRENSILKLSKKILEGSDALVFGEGTWNLHPIIPMHNIRQGVSKISAITQVPIIPTIFEYVEEDCIIKEEKKLYKRCVIRFGNPVMINYENNLINQTNNLKEEMNKIRKQIWCDYGINKNNICDIDPLIYMNHTYLKKFKALGFTYNSKKEQDYLLFLNNEPRENEYSLTNEGNFCPAVTEKNFRFKKVLYK